MAVSLDSNAAPLSDKAAVSPPVRQQAQTSLAAEFQPELRSAQSSLKLLVRPKSLSGAVAPRAGAIGERIGVNALPRGTLMQNPQQSSANRTPRNAYGIGGMAARLTLPMPGARLVGWAGPGLNTSGPTTGGLTSTTQTANLTARIATLPAEGSQALTALTKPGSISEALMWRYGSPNYRIKATLPAASGGSTKAGGSAPSAGPASTVTMSKPNGGTQPVTPVPSSLQSAA